MRTRSIAGIAALAGILMSASPVDAGSRVIAQKSTKHGNAVFLAHGLLTSHDYRVDIVSRGHHSFSSSGFEFYIGVHNHQAFTDHQSLLVSGTTPRSIALKRDARAGVRQWDLSFNVRLLSGSGLTVKLVDLGKHR